MIHGAVRVELFVDLVAVGDPVPPGVEALTADIRYADSAFFAALRIPLEAGYDGDVFEVGAGG